MKKLRVNWRKVALICSIALNLLLMAILIGLYITSHAMSDIGRINSFQDYYCNTNYQRMLDSFDATQDAEHASQLKNTYATTVCLKNYKTGQPLDLSPLLKQVESTPSK